LSSNKRVLKSVQTLIRVFLLPKNEREKSRISIKKDIRFTSILHPLCCGLAIKKGEVLAMAKVQVKLYKIDEYKSINQLGMILFKIFPENFFQEICQIAVKVLGCIWGIIDY
jgi:hypothetical protein